MKYPKGSYMTCHGMRLKVQEVLGDLRFVSTNCEYDDHWEDFSAGSRTVGELERGGWIEEPVIWEPGVEVRYHFIDNELHVGYGFWDGGSVDLCRKNGLGVYQTAEEAQAVIDKIRDFIKTICK